MALFLGHFQYLLDSKNRVNIPARFRELLPADNKTVALFNGLNGCIWVYPVANASEVFDRLSKDEYFLDEDAQRLRTLVLYGSSTETADKQGRITLNEWQRRHAGIQRNLVIVGAYNRMEIWSPERYQAQTLAEGETLKEFAQKVQRKFRRPMGES